MSDWKSVYKIRHVQQHDDGTWDEYQGVGAYDLCAEGYELIYIPTAKVVARYKDHKYARKQARYRYRKDTKRMEKILFSGDMDAKEDLPTMVDST